MIVRCSGMEVLNDAWGRVRITGGAYFICFLWKVLYIGCWYGWSCSNCLGINCFFPIIINFYVVFKKYITADSWLKSMVKGVWTRWWLGVVLWWTVMDFQVLSVIRRWRILNVILSFHFSGSLTVLWRGVLKLIAWHRDSSHG